MAIHLCKYTVTRVYVGHLTAELLLPLVHSGHEKSIGHSRKYPGLLFEFFAVAGDSGDDDRYAGRHDL